MCNILYAEASIFHESDLHKILNNIFIRHNFMVQGKYKQARLYLFKYKNKYFYAKTETGDRGSGWGIFVKPDEDKNILYYAKVITQNKIVKEFLQKIYKEIDMRRHLINHVK